MKRGQEADMKCPKCNGLMVKERFADENAAFHEWKCVNCGYRKPA
jgi:DNA-directed RNA polymerase subunit M/transcription elongation factor TFIIS